MTDALTDLNHDSILTPCRIPQLKHVVLVKSGFHFCAAITVEGRLFTWGDNRYGQLGHSTFKT
jgi:alpha-tubulin suppressor-like RCC1 family protein